ncbi:hypothetical protein [Methylomicrobium sp. Wu6]|uniref:hypothetical protein n=1 Tax=Methylomicrobium sp. Wu6 TaxID=3107928 RepID=UPI002DD6A2B3|nr:hypothetical protein [Methylomicrobium sp. Wu6]MEC4746941.1 hypothetical protein [Methylomicrobium sp. Wu6]
MNPSSTQSRTPSSPFGDLSKSHKKEPCRYCGFSVQVSSSDCCPSCGRRPSDVVSFYIVYEPSHLLASPSFQSFEQVKQFADIFGIHADDGYVVQETIRLYNYARLDAEPRLEQIASLEANTKLLAWLKEKQPYCEGPEELTALARYAGLTVYALPQFRDAAAKGA